MACLLVTNIAFIPEGGSGGENLVKAAGRSVGQDHKGEQVDGVQATPFDGWHVCLWQTLPPSLTRTNKDLEGIFCVKVVGRRVDWRMRERRVLGGAGVGTIGRHVASASTPIPYHSGQHSGSCHHFDGSHVCHHTNPPPPLLATHTVGDIWWQSYPPWSCMPCIPTDAVSDIWSGWYAHLYSCIPCIPTDADWVICPSLLLSALSLSLPCIHCYQTINGAWILQSAVVRRSYWLLAPRDTHLNPSNHCSVEKQLVQRWDFRYNI